MARQIQGISVVVPVHNEQENVIPLAEEVICALSDQYPFELIFVDDASTDQSIATVTAKYPENQQVVRVVKHARNAGQSAAVLTGVRHAKYPWIATLDGDRQNDPQDIVKLAQEAQKQESDLVLVAGIRAQRKDTAIRKLSSRLANSVRGKLLRDQCPDSACGIKLFPRDLFLKLPHFRNFHRFMPALFCRAGAKIINVPVNHRPRVAGESKYGISNRLWVGIVDLIGMAWLMRRPVNAETCSDSES